MKKLLLEASDGETKLGFVENSAVLHRPLAGVVGVVLTRALSDRGMLTAPDDGCAITTEGRRWLAAHRLTLPGGEGAAVRLCPVDWSERRPHVAGALGRALARHLVEASCLVPVRASRALRVTDRGRRWFRDELGLELSAAL